MGEKKELFTKLEQKRKGKKPLFINFALMGDTLFRSWGILDGEVQMTNNTYRGINIGKSNELTPEEVARLDYDRIIKNKVKEGYNIITSDTHIKTEREIFDFEKIPSNFCASKPIQEFDNKKAQRLLSQGKATFTLKYNGLCHFILITPFKEVKIYTRRLDDHTGKYPDIVREIKEMNLPPRTILITEFCIDSLSTNILHMQGFKIMQQISRLDTLKGKLKRNQSQSFKMQKENFVNVVVFGILFWNGEEVKIPWKEMIDSDMFSVFSYYDNIVLKHICTPRRFDFKNTEDAIYWLKKHEKQVEGFVLNFHDQNIQVTWTGKPKRTGSMKLKLQKEDDVIAYGWKEGTGKNQGRIGSLYIGKMKNGKIIPLGRASGLKDNMKNPNSWDFPCVIEIKFAARFKSGLYQFPKFVKIHEDKLPQDCVLEEEFYA